MDDKFFYEAPTVTVVDVKLDSGILTASKDQYNPIPF